MFKQTFQSGILSLFYSCGSKPLSLWSKTVKSGYVKRLTDEHLQSLVLEIAGSNIVSTYISCPSDITQTLGIRLPHLVILLKNLRKYFSFEVQILDDKNVRRRFRVSNYQTATKVRPFTCNLPLGLNPGWNQLHFDLIDFTRRSYGTAYVETLRVQVHANCRLRRIYFTDRMYTDEELPAEYRLLYPNH